MYVYVFGNVINVNKVCVYIYIIRKYEYYSYIIYKINASATTGKKINVIVVSEASSPTWKSIHIPLNLICLLKKVLY